MKELKTVSYEPSLGEYTLPEGFEERMKDLSIEEQKALFTTEVVSYYRSACVFKRTLEENSDVKGIIVKDNMIIGIMISDAFNLTRPAFIDQQICTWDSSDNNGAGYISREEYTTLLYLPGYEEK